MNVRQLLPMLEECDSFIARHSEEWYRSGQELLTQVRTAIKEIQNTCEHDIWSPHTTIEVIDKYKAKCTVCINFFDLPIRKENKQ
jgi:glycogen synthase